MFENGENVKETQSWNQVQQDFLHIYVSDEKKTKSKKKNWFEDFRAVVVALRLEHRLIKMVVMSSNPAGFFLLFSFLACLSIKHRISEGVASLLIMWKLKLDCKLCTTVSIATKWLNTLKIWKFVSNLAVNKWGSIRCKQIARWPYLSRMKNDSYCF